MKEILMVAVVLTAIVGGLSQAAAATKRATVVSTASSRFGQILVDSRGRTLYLFEKDRRGHSACSGACAVYWPPLLTAGRPSASHNAKLSLLGVIRRSDGTRQVTYAGHPLYRFVQDTKPGQTTGQGLDQFGAEWYVLEPAGTKIENGS